MFKFHCSHCQQKLSVEAAQSGETLQCPACGVDFVIPSPAEEVMIEPQSREESAETTKSHEIQPGQSNQPTPSPEPGASHSFADRLRDGSKAAQEGAKLVKKGAMVGWAGLKRRSKQAALRAQIEKLRNIDLRKALHSLGKKTFELGVIADGVAEQFQAICDLDARIAEMRDKAAVDTGETKMAALKRVSKDTAKASQAQALTVKREHLITELGREIHAHKVLMSMQELSDESAAIADIEHRIRNKEDEMHALDDRGRSGMQMLAVAAAIGLLAVASALIAINLMGKNGEQESSGKAPVVKDLSWCAENGDLNGVKSFLNPGSIDGAAGQKTPLHLAAAGGHRKVVEYLISQGADIDKTYGDYGWNPIHFAASSGHAEVVALLIDKGAKIDVSDDKGNYPIHTAASRGHIDVIKVLLKSGVKPDQESYAMQEVGLSAPNKFQPIHSSAKYNQLQVVKFLIDLGISPNTKDTYGTNVLGYALTLDGWCGSRAELIRLLDPDGVIERTSKEFISTQGYYVTSEVNPTYIRFMPEELDNSKDSDDIYRTIRKAVISRGARGGTSSVEIAKWLSPYNEEAKKQGNFITGRYKLYGTSASLDHHNDGGSITFSRAGNQLKVSFITMQQQFFSESGSGNVMTCKFVSWK